jgi:hypothetical protein
MGCFGLEEGLKHTKVLEKAIIRKQQKNEQATDKGMVNKKAPIIASSLLKRYKTQLFLFVPH